MTTTPARPARHGIGTRPGVLTTWGGALLAAVLATGVLWFRLGATTRGIVWAEDSGRFLQDRLDGGPFATILMPYEGYLHLVPRLVVDAAVRFFPIESYAVAISGMSCAVVGLVAAAVFVLARDVVRTAPLRLLLAIVPAVTPLMPVEIAGNAANLHWFLLFLAPWVFSYRPRTWWSSAVLAVLALVITLTEIQAAMFIPLFARQLRGPRGLPPAVAAVTGAAAQLVTTVLHPRSPATDLAAGRTGGVVDFAAGFAAQPVGGLWAPDPHAIGRVVQAHGWWVVVVPAIVLFALLVMTAVLRDGAARWMVVAVTVAPLVIWFVSLAVNDVVTNWLSFSPVDWAVLRPLRYGAVASAFLLAGVVIAADTLIGRGRAHPARDAVLLPVLGWVLVAGVVATAVVNVRPETRREEPGVLPWSTQVQQQREACAADPGARVTLRAAPGLAKWDAHVPCALVDRH